MNNNKTRTLQMIDIDCMFVLPPVGIDENPAIIIVHSDGLVNLYCCL